MTFAKILCPTDFSDGARHALELASRIAVQQDAELVIAHIWDVTIFSTDGGFALAPEVVEATVDDMKRLLVESARVAKELGVSQVSTRELRGIPFRAIIDLVAEHGIDLVVMGTHGRSGLRRVLLGSVAEKVVRLASSSVLAVHPEDKLGAFHRVLCPTDLTDPTEYPLQLAAKVVDVTTDARIELVHVVDLPTWGEPESQRVSITRDHEAAAATELARRTQKIFAPCPIVARTEVGPVAEQLLTLVEVEPYDLVVVGSHGRTGLKHLMLGSIAEKLVRHARCPVLVARAPRAS